MKQCPLCGRTFTEDNQFCLEDGTMLSPADAMPTQVYLGDEPTVVAQKIPPTQYFETPTQFQTPPQFQTPQSSPQMQTKSTATWVYPVLGLLVAVIFILGFLVIFQLTKKNEIAVTNANSTNKETPKTSETPMPTTTVQPTKAPQTYDSNVGKYPEGSTRYLNEDDLYGKSDGELRIMRNEIFARHRRRFKSADLRNYFMSQPWYNPQFDEVKLTEIETRNVQFLKNYE